jgi:hypothetical protein
MCLCTRRRSVRSSTNSHEPAAKIPSNTITNVASKLFSICQSPFSLYLQSGSYILFRGFPVQASTRSGVAVLDLVSPDLDRLSASALTEPLAVTLTVAIDFHFNLPEHIQQ